jgi:hypothetical protein
MGIGQLSLKLGMSRQNYYKERKRRMRQEADGGLIERLVRRERAVQPRLGGRKLLHMLKPQLARAGVSIGRDRFFGVLRAKRLLLEPLPAAFAASALCNNSAGSCPASGLTAQCPSDTSNRPPSLSPSRKRYAVLSF